MRVVWTARASFHLEEIADHIAGASLPAATRMTRRIVSSMARLAAHPYMGKSGRVPGTRELVIGGTAYVGAYRVIEDRIEILAVRHGMRDWPKNL